MKLLRCLPAIIWMCFMFYLSSQQTSSIHGTISERFYILKSFHIIEYAVLAGLVYLALPNFIRATLISYFFALSDEYHQTFVLGRTGRLFDTLYDLVGITFGLFLIFGIIQFFNSKFKRK